MSYNLQEMEKFLCARDRILGAVHGHIGDQRMGKGFEGVVHLTFPSLMEDLYGDATVTAAVDSTVVFSKYNAWSGSSLSEVADKMNKDVDLYEKNLARQPNNPDN